jgi:hypothetical protein
MDRNGTVVLGLCVQLFRTGGQGMRKLIIVIAVAYALAVPKPALAELNTDIRVKLGSAPGINKFEANGLTAGLDKDGGGNFQVEVALSPVQENPVGFVFSAGIFGRTHKGTENTFPQTEIEYNAGGLSFAGGVGIKASPNFHFEGKLGLDLGAGKPKSTPSVGWVSTEDRGYAALSLIFGGYYSVSKPGFQIGLELGAQSWAGDFRFMNSFGQWSDATVKGNGGFVNLVIGSRF